jgi:hypothetical protein
MRVFYPSKDKAKKKVAEAIKEETEVDMLANKTYEEHASKKAKPKFVVSL